MLSSLENKIALVTGATRGIGREIALKLGKMGAFVIGTATSEAGAAKITEFLKESNINGLGVVLNIAANDVEDNIKAIIKEHGNIGILVNNAGITRDNLMLRMSDAEWSEVIQTNLTGTFRATKACLRGMVKARFGRIITISSVVGVMGNAGQANYAASKAGVIGFSKSLAKEISSRGITVNVIAPGFIATDMTEALGDAQKEALLQQIPCGDLGSVSDIANGVGFLASDEARYITGETLHINGGMLMD